MVDDDVEEGVIDVVLVVVLCVGLLLDDRAGEVGAEVLDVGAVLPAVEPAPGPEPESEPAAALLEELTACESPVQPATPIAIIDMRLTAIGRRAVPIGVNLGSYGRYVQVVTGPDNSGQAELTPSRPRMPTGGADPSL